MKPIFQTSEFHQQRGIAQLLSFSLSHFPEHSQLPLPDHHFIPSAIIGLQTTPIVPVVQHVVRPFEILYSQLNNGVPFSPDVSGEYNDAAYSVD
jgi:hypothetical protein